MGLGIAASQAVFPVANAAFVSVYGWRGCWFIWGLLLGECCDVSLFVLCVCVCVCVTLLNVVWHFTVIAFVPITQFCVHNNPAQVSLID